MRPVFSFSDTWQLVINTGTVVVTFLMVLVLHERARTEKASRSKRQNTS